jgi:phosphate transport system substrate-binding protein
MLSLDACKSNVKVDPIENINKGSISILCDKDFQSLMLQHKEVYEHLYPEANINFEFLSDGEIMSKLAQRQGQCAVIGRRLSEQERLMLQSIDTIIPREHLPAKDALVFIVGKNNSQFGTKNWSAFFQELTINKSLQIVFPHRQSGLVKSFSFIDSLSVSNSFFGLDSLMAVVDYVNKNNNAIGAISYASIADSDRASTKELLKKVKVIKFSVADSASKSVVVTASEQDIATGQYPLIRPINYILLNPSERIGMGFANYLMRNRGAKVFLKAGVIPSVMPERDFIVNTTGIEIKKD